MAQYLNITNLLDPQNNADAANKKYVDAQHNINSQFILYSIIQSKPGIMMGPFNYTSSILPPTTNTISGTKLALTYTYQPNRDTNWFTPFLEIQYKNGSGTLLSVPQSAWNTLPPWTALTGGDLLINNDWNLQYLYQSFTLDVQLLATSATAITEEGQCVINLASYTGNTYQKLLSIDLHQLNTGLTQGVASATQAVICKNSFISDFNYISVYMTGSGTYPTFQDYSTSAVNTSVNSFSVKYNAMQAPPGLTLNTDFVII